MSVPVFGWFCAWVGPTMPGIGLFALLNCLVHVVMYSYYALAALGPAVRRHLWWKRYITQLQLVQFVVFTAYGFVLLANESGYPLYYKLLPTVQPPLFFALFYNFYRQSYKKSIRLSDKAAVGKLKEN